MSLATIDQTRPAFTAPTVTRAPAPAEAPAPRLRAVPAGTEARGFVLDPMLATGGSLIAAITYLFDRGAVDVTCICLIGAPEGIAAVEAATVGKEVHLVLGALDEKLNEVGYIVPGLGDAGDRLYGTV